MIKDEYRRERRRVQDLVRRYKKQGYDVEVKIPKLVKNPTEKSISRLKSITARQVRQNSYAPDLETGERINVNTYKGRYKKLTPSKAYEILEHGGVYVGDVNIAYFERIVDNYPDKTRELVLTGLRGAISVYGESMVDDALGKMISDGDIVEPSDAYNYRLVSHMMENLASLLRLDEQQLHDINTSFLEEADSQQYYDG